MNARPLGWGGIARLGLVQTALGSIVVLATATMNRVMIIELALPAMVPGALVGLHYAIQVLRPRFGHGSDGGRRRTPWIVGGMAVLALGALCAALAIAWIPSARVAGLALAVVGFAGIGVGVGAAGTSLLVLLAKRVEPARRAPAATIVWVMMLLGFIVTAGVAGAMLDPYSAQRLVVVTATVGAIAFALTLCAVWGVERGVDAPDPLDDTEAAARALPPTRFREALAQVWAEPQARRFTVFVFVSMIAYSAQDLVLEPFAGAVFGYPPGASTQLSSVQHAGVLIGMVLVALTASVWRGARQSTRGWTVAGCVASAIALAMMALGAYVGPGWPLRTGVFVLGVTNGAYAVAAIGSMMELAGQGREAREGVRMGLWGAAQAVAFGLGGFLGTAAIDVARWMIASTQLAYAAVFAGGALLFLVAGNFAAAVRPARAPSAAARLASTRTAIERG